MPTNYLRAGLMRGLAQEEVLGENPFKFGFVGGTDSHIGASGAVARRPVPRPRRRRRAVPTA